MKTKNYFLSLSIACLLLFGVNAKAQLIIYEPASDAQAAGANLTTPTYVLNATSPDPDGGLNAGNGLPASTNVTADPAGTSTGLRSSWGSQIKVVDGLTYSNTGGTLSTTGNALMHTGTGFGDQMYLYRRMTTDPHNSYRSDENYFGWNTLTGTTTLYFSLLLNVNDIANEGGATAKQLQIRTKLDGNNGNNGGLIFQQNTAASNWELFLGNTSKGVLGNAVANQTEFIVGRFVFTSATSTTIDVWFNPTLNASLPIPTQSFTYEGALAGNIQTYSFRSGNNKLIVDELRIGLSANDVMPLNLSTSVVKTSVTDRVYQNAANQIYVDLNALNASVVQVIDTKGAVISLQKTTGKSFVNVNLPNKGVYIVRIQSSEGPLLQKVVLK